MLDIAFIRENKDLVEEKAKQKGLPVNIKRLLALDTERRDLLKTVEDLRKKRNELSKTDKGKPSQDQINAVKQLKIELAERRRYLDETEAEYLRLLKTVPNMPLETVPIGTSPADNKISFEWGTKPEFQFKPKTHWQLGEESGLIDKKRAAKVAGARFAYLAGWAVQLQFALINWTINVLTDQAVLNGIIKLNKLNTTAAPFIPVLPPYMLKTAVFDAMDRLDPRDDRYKVGEDRDDLWLEGSAEHVLGPLHMNETISEDELPIRYLGYATSFRREAGSYGKDTEGIVRLHQFDKLEMESITASANGEDEHKFLIAIQEYLLQQLNLHYRRISKCTADIGKPNASGVDLEVWMPGEGRYLETHTADYMTDFQARRLATKIKTENSLEFAYTNDATALALGRTIAAIMENYQTKDGTIGLPNVLKEYFKGDGSI